MIFSDSPQQRAMERMMTAVPRFRPRCSGLRVQPDFEYTAEMCDCRLCLYYNRKRKCTAIQCPCIEERIVAGAASRAEVMAETMKDTHNAAFCRRLNQFINESEELYNDILSFTEAPDGRTVIVKREKICDNCAAEKPQKKGAEDTITLFDFLNGLSDEQQKAAFAHLKLKWDRVQGSGLYGRS